MPFVDVNGQHVYYEDTGGTGPAIVFSHGFAMDQDMYAAQVAALRDTFRCITWDYRDHGQTRGDGGPYSVLDLADDLAALLATLGISRVGVVGFSMGGWVSTRLALAHPDLVAALAIVDSYERMESPEVAAGYAQIKSSLLEHGFNIDMVAMLRGFLFGPDYDASVWIGKWRARSPHLLAPGYDAMFGRDDINDRLGAIRCPSIVLHGEHNPANGPEVSQELADRLGACEGTRIVPGSGHTSTVERPEFVNETLLVFFQRSLGTSTSTT